MNPKNNTSNTRDAVEVNFDGLIGSTHNYGGLSRGNIASANNALQVSMPKQAALQGLKKMRYLQSLGLSQGILLPQQRPHLPTLHALGLRGSDEQIIAKAVKLGPEFLANCYSASSMWAANACTVSPSADSVDGKVHFTAANLNSMFHRSIEHNTTSQLLKIIFPDANYFQHHSALPAGLQFGDEGAANHNRFAPTYGDAGVQLFVFGRYAFKSNSAVTRKFPSRQTYEASKAISRLHRLSSEKVVFAQQNPNIIDAGAFHNDVVSVSNLNTFFMHEEAFLDKEALQLELQSKCDHELHFIEVPTAQVPLKAAVKSYLFNSQLVQTSKGMTLILPEESREDKAVYAYLQSLQTQDTTISDVQFVDVRQSMRNGGGPACLRLRVVLNQTELQAVNSRFLMTEALFQRLSDWVNTHYRDEIAPADLADPALARESFAALDELTQIFELGAFYEFQH